MPADQQACAQRLRGASLQLVTVLLRALHAASLPVLPGGTDVTADAAAAAAAAAAVLPLPPLRLQTPLASLLGGVERGNLCRRATDAGAGAGAMELSVGAVFTWVLRLWEDELRRGLTVSELRVRQLADVDLSAQRGPGPGPAPPRRRPTHTGLLPTASWPFSAGYHPPSLAGYHTLFLPPLVIAPSFQPTGAPRLPRAPRTALRWCGAPPRRRRSPRAVRLRDRAAETVDRRYPRGGAARPRSGGCFTATPTRLHPLKWVGLSSWLLQVGPASYHPISHEAAAGRHPL